MDFLGDETDCLTCQSPRGSDIVSIDCRRAGRFLYQSGEDADEGGFSGAVWPKERKYFALVNVYRYVVECANSRIIGFRKPLRGEH